MLTPASGCTQPVLEERDGADSPDQDQFDDYRESTIGAAFLTQTISLDETTTVKFEIWDTAGQERYKSLAPMYYRNANCAVVVYDITQAVRSAASTYLDCVC